MTPNSHPLELPHELPGIHTSPGAASIAGLDDVARLRETREARLEEHCLDLCNTMLFSHRTKNVLLASTDQLSLPAHKYVLGAQSKCAPPPWDAAQLASSGGLPASRAHSCPSQTHSGPRPARPVSTAACFVSPASLGRPSLSEMLLSWRVAVACRGRQQLSWPRPETGRARAGFSRCSSTAEALTTCSRTPS